MTPASGPSTTKRNTAYWAAYWAAKGIARPNTVLQFWRDRREADRRWESERPAALTDLGAVPHLSILPLVEHYSAVDGLATEPGVSYLVTFDEEELLFDVGYNMGSEHPSPLLRNMELLGISPSDLDEIFISHRHHDHVGGRAAQAAKTFTLSSEPVDLEGVRAFVPPSLSHPSARVTVIDAPRRLAPGVASSGPLMRAIWLTGSVLEQNLLVNVAGKGVVMIVGCGHPSLARMIERAKAVTGEPLYGIVGGLHFPVTASRVGRGGQRIVGNGKLPWQRITRDEVKEAAALLAGLDLELVALSAHDSCDWSLGIFRDALGGRFQIVKAGEAITVA